MTADLEFHCRASGGPSSGVTSAGRAVRATKRIVQVQVRFAERLTIVETPEGSVRARAGDAIVTGAVGEQWPVGARRFAARYRPVPPTVAGQPGTYLSVPREVVAVEMDRSFAVVLDDGESRLHGKSGDWLMDYGDGSLGVVSADIFPVLYEVID